MGLTVQTLYVIPLSFPAINYQFYTLSAAPLAGDSHDGRDDEDPRGPDETDGKHREADILGLIEVTS